MEIDWKEIYVRDNPEEPRKMKFQILPRPIPWAGDFQENIDFTVEWLFREGKREKVRYAKDTILVEATNGWYTIETEEGQFLHACYPQDILKFRGQYESLREQIMGVDVENLSMITQTAESSRELLWSAWNCIGGDGRREEPERFSKTYAPGDIIEYEPIIPPDEWPRVYHYQCYKCCDPLPKALKLWQKMQHGKLKEMV